MVKPPPGATLVALPYVSKDGFAGPCVKSLLGWFSTPTASPVTFLFIRDKTQVEARNHACDKAMELGAEWIWFVDSDQDFPPDALERLKSVDADVACADMWSRSWPSFRIVFRATPPDDIGKVLHVPVDDSVASNGGVEDITYCGMGCTLVKTSIVRRMRERFPDQPCFWVAYHGEDATFCFKVLEMGGTVKCDFGLKSGHWGSIRMMGQEFTRDSSSLMEAS